MIPIYLTAHTAPSHTLLARAAALSTGLPEADFGALHTLPGGKPVFSRHPALQFSLSHSGDLWACAFSDAPVGLDIQKIVEKPVERLSRRWFHPAETAYLEAHGFSRFFEVWCAKESVVKYLGTGIDGSFQKFAAADENGLLAGVGDVQLLPFSPAEGYCGCLAAERREEIRLIRF